jgi:predicted RNA-binding Zn-ribbon protein involved in translation (DUF1610 family)
VISLNDLLLGQIAVERGLISKAQLEDCIKQQQKGDGRNGPALGSLLVSKGLLKDKDLNGLLDEQSKRVKSLEDFKKLQTADYLFGQLLVKHNLATQLQINKCLEIQLRMAEKGTQPIPRVGELLLEHGFVDRKTVADVLKMQSKNVLYCTACARQYNVVGVEEGKAYRCKECGGVMLRREVLDTLKAEDTMFGFEMPTEER